MGIENGSFKWNEVEEKKGETAKKASNGSENDDIGSDTAVGSPSEGDEDHRFELRDINVTFPDGQLSLITGPTASGKTALLVEHFLKTLLPSS